MSLLNVRVPGPGDYDVLKGEYVGPREDLTDIVMTMCAPYAARFGWSHEALETFVREKLRTLREPPWGYAGETKVNRAHAKAKWFHDHIVCALINEVI